ncbi:hypothetical protein V8F20_004442 [Naviculisporaceae sp. PSN 640]
MAESTSIDPVADLPSGEPIPIPSTPDLSIPKPQPLPLRALLLATPSNLDAFLARLNKCLSTPSGIDTVLLLVCYSSKFGAALLAHLSKSILQRSAREWLAVLASLAAKTNSTVIATAEIPSTAKTAAAAAALDLSKRLNALSSLTSEARTISRLWALLGMYFWGRGLVAKILASRRKTSTSEKAEEAPAAAGTKTDLLISATQLSLCVALQALENGAFLSSKGVMSWSPATQGWAYKWSVRFWAAYIGVELGKLAAERFGGQGQSLKTQAEQDAWRDKFARNLAWAPLTIHWSLDGGLAGFNEGVVGLLGSIPGLIQMRELWKASGPA